MLSASPRSRAGNSPWTDESACGAIAAAARPCRSRPKISAAGDQARPHNAEASANPARPIEKDRLAAKNVAEPAAGDQEDGIDDGIAGDDELGVARRGVQTRPDRGQRQIDDEEIERREKGADQQDDERRPATRVELLSASSPMEDVGSRGLETCAIVIILLFID